MIRIEPLIPILEDGYQNSWLNMGTPWYHGYQKSKVLFPEALQK